MQRSESDCPVFSVIVPAYCMERYIDQCVQSIINQSFAGFEVVLIDDGSTDATPELCDRWAERENRVTVVHTVNKGLSAARNTGLGRARGEWVFFVDSDDELAENALERLLPYVDDADLIAFGWDLVDETGALLKRCSPGARIAENSLSLIRQIVSGPLNDYVWSYVFRRKALEQLPFDKPFDERIRLFEDVEFLQKFLRVRSLRATTIPDVLYRHRRVRGSLSKKPNPRIAGSGLEVVARLSRLEVPDGLRAAWQAKLIMLLLGTYQLSYGREGKTLRRKIREEMLQYADAESIGSLQRAQRLKYALWRWHVYPLFQLAYRFLSFGREDALRKMRRMGGAVGGSDGRVEKEDEARRS